ncbi:MAG TPA: hypothetical protein PLV92_14200 [Pirellulaceae bacterium]|nr:hypothetical protein [Pirellulaceae bacterium]
MDRRSSRPKRSDFERSNAERSDFERSDFERSDVERSDVERSDAERSNDRRSNSMRAKKDAAMNCSVSTSGNRSTQCVSADGAFKNQPNARDFR